jgi:hypothetical protein
MQTDQIKTIVKCDHSKKCNTPNCWHMYPHPKINNCIPLPCDRINVITMCNSI